MMIEYNENTRKVKAYVFDDKCTGKGNARD